MSRTTPAQSDHDSAQSDRDSAAGHPTARRRLRILVPSLLIVIWLVGASFGGSMFARLGEVTSNDQANYLPNSAEATKVQKLLGPFNGSDDMPAIAVFTSTTKLSTDQVAAINDALKKLPDLAGVGDTVSPAVPSSDGLALQAFVPIRSDSDVGAVVATVSQALQTDVPSGVAVHVTGPAGFIGDLTAALSGIDGLLLVVALVAVFVILVLVYRSLILPVLVLATSMFALCVALLCVWALAKAGVLLLSGQTQGILFILVIGAATDYSLLYVSRYREELHTQADRWQATKNAWRGTIKPIVAAGGTVIVSLLCLLLSELKSNSTLGPIASIGIVFAMASALTLLPSLLLLCGRVAFWPRIPHYDPATVAGEDRVHTTGLWAWLGRTIAAHARPLWIVTAVVLAVGVAGATQLAASGVPQSDLVLGASPARAGQVLLGDHFSGGSGSPVLVVVAKDQMQDAANLLLQHPGIDGVSVVATGTSRGSAPITADGIKVFGPPGTPAPQPTVVNGDVMLQATLTDAADSDAAEDTVRSVRADLATTIPTALVGGVTAIAIDTNDASIRDRNVIIPLVLLVIFVLLALVLRSLLAPLLLMATTVLSFGTALGVAALVFNHVLDFPGADPAVPVYGFVFLVALGIDYNVFLMTRVREEAHAHGTRTGILRGLAVTGGVITSAGIVLAATFAALSVIPILFLVQIAFIVAFGVLLDTFLVRSVLVPSLSYDIGRALWWPSGLAKAER